VASFGAFLAFLDATIVNVAFPSIRDSFSDTTISELSWVLNAYNIVFAASLILCGRLTDLVGRRRSFVAGVTLFTVGTGGPDYDLSTVMEALRWRADRLPEPIEGLA